MNNNFLILITSLMLLPVTNNCTGGTESKVEAKNTTNYIQLCSEYNRDEFRAWIDQDNDCQDTRAEVLISESLSGITFTTSPECFVSSGQWYDPYTDNTYYFASDLDVDHLVPLKEAYDSGALYWSSSKKESYGNDLSNPNQLIAVSSSTNRTKGARDPGEWLPENLDYLVDYAKSWVEIKVNWELSADSNELQVLHSILDGLPGIIYPAEAEEQTCTNTTGTYNPPSNTSCCKICTTGKACGDSCISKSYNCTKPSGCACNG